MLKECKECGKEVSSTARTCPNCGVSNPCLTSKSVKRSCLFLVAAFLALGIALYSIIPDSEQAFPEVEAFLSSHSQFGSLLYVEAMPNWERGRRQQVKTSNGNYLFYMEGGEVVTVYVNDVSGRKEVWRK